MLAEEREERQMCDEKMKQEIREAAGAGARALVSLRAAQEKLESARKWGIVDILGGGFITDVIKHSRMDDAAACMETARTDLQRFQKELKDVNIPSDLRMEVGGFLSFADFFLDGFVSDYLVQTRIADAREQVEDAIRYVERLITELKQVKEN